MAALVTIVLLVTSRVPGPGEEEERLRNVKQICREPSHLLIAHSHSHIPWLVIILANGTSINLDKW